MKRFFLEGCASLCMLVALFVLCVFAEGGLGLFVTIVLETICGISALLLYSQSIDLATAEEAQAKNKKEAFVAVQKSVQSTHGMRVPLCVKQNIGKRFLHMVMEKNQATRKPISHKEKSTRKRVCNLHIA